MFKTQIKEINRGVTETDVTHVHIGTIIRIIGAGFYIFARVSDKSVALIGINSGNRWDEPMTIDDGDAPFFSLDLVGAMIGDDFEFEVVNQACFSFS